MHSPVGPQSGQPKVHYFRVTKSHRLQDKAAKVACFKRRGGSSCTMSLGWKLHTLVRYESNLHVMTTQKSSKFGPVHTKPRALRR